MQNSIDCGIFEALWNPIKQNYEQIISRSPNTDVFTILKIKDEGEREISVYITDVDKRGKSRIIKCPLSQFPEDRDIQEAAKYFISV